VILVHCTMQSKPTVGHCDC